MPFFFFFFPISQIAFSGNFIPSDLVTLSPRQRGLRSAAVTCGSGWHRFSSSRNRSSPAWVCNTRPVCLLNLAFPVCWHRCEPHNKHQNWVAPSGVLAGVAQLGVLSPRGTATCPSSQHCFPQPPSWRWWCLHPNPLEEAVQCIFMMSLRAELPVVGVLWSPAWPGSCGLR